MQKGVSVNVQVNVLSSLAPDLISGSQVTLVRKFDVRWQYLQRECHPAFANPTWYNDSKYAKGLLCLKAHWNITTLGTTINKTLMCLSASISA